MLAAAGRWLDLYFAGRRPHFTPPLHLTGTEFRMAVWSLLQEIPYGETITYGELARQLAQRLELPHMSAQAVGGAVGHNPISLIPGQSASVPRTTDPPGPRHLPP